MVTQQQGNMVFLHSTIMVDVAPDYVTAGVACCHVVSRTLIHLYIDRPQEG